MNPIVFLHHFSLDFARERGESKRVEKTAKWGFQLGDIPIVFDITVIITTTVTCLIVLLISILAARKVTFVPKGIQNAVEMIIDFTKGIVQSSMDVKTASRFYGLAFTLFLFLFVANELGLMFNVVTEHDQPLSLLGIETEHQAEDEQDQQNTYAWWKSPTADINVVFSMALGISILSNFLGIKRSPKQYIKQYFQPYPWLFPMHVIEELVKPLTHGIRLWANIFAGEVLVIILLQANPLFTGAPLIVWIGYSLFVGLVQAYVFTVLAFVYISQKISTNH